MLSTICSGTATSTVSTVSSAAALSCFLDVLPRRFRPVIFRQAPYQAAHIGERFSGHDGRNFERPR